MLTADIKAMILGALQAKGGQAYLERCADANPTAFLALVGKILPLTVDASITRDVQDLTDAELIAIASQPRSTRGARDAGNLRARSRVAAVERRPLKGTKHQISKSDRCKPSGACLRCRWHNAGLRRTELVGRSDEYCERRYGAESGLFGEMQMKRAHLPPVRLGPRSQA